MRKTLLALAASSALVMAGTAAPTPAQAHSWWVVPAIIGGALVTSAIVANAAGYYGPYYRPAFYRPAFYGSGYYGPGYYGTVSVRPSCRVVRERTSYGWRRVRICG